MEAIRISCAGYPTRRSFDEFVDRFGLLAPEVLNGRWFLSVLIKKCITYHFNLHLIY